ncbi:MAG: PQQ-dependent sugar dehydrogenase [Vicinamibacterales bacterium]
MPNPTGRATALATVFLCLATGASGQALRAQLYVGGFTNPVAFVQDPSNPGLQYVVEQRGRIRVIQNGALVATPFLDITTSVLGGGERGLLGLAFAPDYATSRRFYVNFTRAGDGHTVIARFRRSAGNPLVADPLSRFDLTWSTGLDHIEQPYPNHNGGNMAFGPDGYLYIGMGDGGSGGDPQNHAQNPDSLLGKMLRIDVDVPDSDPQGFDVPPDNPFVDGDPVDAAPEIWSFGFRNPWRWSFDDPAHGGTGALVIGDVGQSNREEIDYEPAGRGGRNYGWRLMEGTQVFTSGMPAYLPLRPPVFDLPRALATSISGGFVYRGRMLGSSFGGRYFFADFYGRVYSIRLTIDPTTREATASDFTNHLDDLGSVGNVSAFGVDSQAELYIVSWSLGQILRVLPESGAPPAATLRGPSGTISTDTPTFTWNAVGTSEWYYLWVTDRGGVRVQQWYTSAAAGCGGGSGVCSATPQIPVAAGSATWWIRTWNRSSGFGPWSAGRSFAPSVPTAPTLLSPVGSIPTATPAYRWNATPLATFSQLWVNDAGGNPVRQWYSSAAAGCASGTGVCAVTPAIRIDPAPADWWIQGWNTVGYGPWSTRARFVVTPPGSATLVAPGGTVATSAPTFSWNASPTATHYYLWVNDEATGTPRIQKWYSAAEADCAGGTGSCAIGAQTTLASGGHRWWIQTWNDAGYGPWSSSLVFSIP